MYEKKKNQSEMQGRANTRVSLTPAATFRSSETLHKPPGKNKCDGISLTPQVASEGVENLRLLIKTAREERRRAEVCVSPPPAEAPPALASPQASASLLCPPLSDRPSPSQLLFHAPHSCHFFFRVIYQCRPQSLRSQGLAS